MDWIIANWSWIAALLGVMGGIAVIIRKWMAAGHIVHKKVPVEVRYDWLTGMRWTRYETHYESVPFRIRWIRFWTEWGNDD